MNGAFHYYSERIAKDYFAEKNRLAPLTAQYCHPKVILAGAVQVLAIIVQERLIPAGKFVNL